MATSTFAGPIRVKRHAAYPHFAEGACEHCGGRLGDSSTVVLLCREPDMSIMLHERCAEALGKRMRYPGLQEEVR